MLCIKDGHIIDPTPKAYEVVYKALGYVPYTPDVAPVAETPAKETPVMEAPKPKRAKKK